MVKRFYLLSFVCAFSICAMAQNELLNENFDSGASLGWTKIDADGDGNNWFEAKRFITSFSYDPPSTAFFPDNWLITPLAEGAAKLSYKVANSIVMSPPEYFEEHYGVFVSTGGINIDDFTLVFEEILTQAESNEMFKEREILLPAGTRYVAFRHYDVSNKCNVAIDDVIIYDDATSISSLPKKDFKLITQSNLLLIDVQSKDVDFSIYRMDGRLMKHDTAKVGTNSIYLTQGVYIVKINRLSYKVFIP